MKMSKKMKAAITVAAIAGTCALSSPSFAAWTPDAPTKLGTNLVSSTAIAGTGMIAVGQDGKAYSMTNDAMTGTPAWVNSYPEATADFAGVTNDGNEFFAVTTNGTILLNDAADASWTDITKAATRTVFKDKTVAGIASVDDDKIVVVATDGSCAFSDNNGDTWSDISTNLKAADVATNGITGVVGFDGTNVLVFGKSASDGTGKNLVKVPVGGSAVTEYKVTNCDNINAVAVATTGVYVAGDGGKVVRMDQEFSDPAAAALSISGSPTTNFKAIAYNGGETYGYVAGADGSLYHIENDTITKRDVSALTAKDLNDLTMIISKGKRRTFAAGNDGVSIYNDETYWADVDAETLPAGAGLLTNSGSSYYSVGDDKILYVSSDKGATWAAASTDAGITNKPSLRLIESGGVVFTADATAQKIIAYTPNTGTPAAPKQTGEAGAEIVDIAILNGNVYAAVETDLVTVPVGFAADDSVVQGANVNPLAAEQLAATTNGLYLFDVDSGTAQIKAMCGNGGALLTSRAATNNALERATGLETALAAAGLAAMATGDKLISLSDGKFAYVDMDVKKVYIVSETAAGVDVTTESNFNVDANADNYVFTNAPVAISGSSTAMFVSDGTDVWYFDGTNYTKYDSVSDSTNLTATQVDVLASSSASVMALDSAATKLAFSEGTQFQVAAGDQFPVSSSIVSAFNATKSDIYVAGDDGLLYNATKKAGASSLVWSDRYQESFFGTKNITKVTGAADTVFAVYDAHDMASKKLSETKWTNLTLAGSASRATFNDVQALDATTVFVADSASGLLKGELSGSTMTFTKQDKSAASDDLPDSLTALSVLDDSHIYAVSGSSTTAELTVFTDGNSDVWTVADVNLPAPNTLNDVVAIAADKIYAVGDSGYAVSYDGSEVTKLSAPTSYNLTSCWAYDGVLYAADNNGQVHEYNLESKVWTSGTVQANVAIRDITGSSKGEYLLAVGTKGTSEISSINSAGGGQTTTKTQPGAGEDADLVATASVETKTSAELTSAYKTPAMDVIGQQQSFKTKTGLTTGSVHNFKFNVTPASATSVSDIKLYKLLAADGGSNITYNRVDTAPSSATDGTFWITDQNDVVMQSGETLAANTVYSVNLGIKDGGEYDIDTADGVIEDPTVLGATSSSSSSGCVFNPVQSFGLEWLMLMAAPFLAVIRNRFKK